LDGVVNIEKRRILFQVEELHHYFGDGITARFDLEMIAK